MTSWRDGVPQQAQQDLDDLLSLTVGYAEQQLDAYRGFVPFAAVVDLTDGPTMVGVQFDDDDHLETGRVISTLTAALAGERSRWRATAVVADVTLGAEPATDAVRVLLEHEVGVALTVLRPYRAAGADLEYYELLVSDALPNIWPERPAVS